MTVKPSLSVPGLHSFRQNLGNKKNSAESLVETAISLLAKRQIRGSRECAEATALLLRTLIDRWELTDAVQLLLYVRDVGDKLTMAQAAEPAVDNMVRRIKGLIAEEIERERLHTTSKAIDVEAHATSCLDLLSATPAQKTVFTHMNETHGQMQTNVAPSAGDRPGVPNETSDPIAEVVGGIDELLDELRQADDQIAAYAPDFVGSHDTILTNSTSRGITRFLLRAANKRKVAVLQVHSFSEESDSLNVVKSTGAERAGSDKLGKSLLDAGISVTLIPETAVFALMPQISKVLLDVDTVFADGSSLAKAGTKAIAMAAKYHNRSIIILSGVYKMSPRCVLDHRALLVSGDPAKTLGLADRKSLFGILGQASPLNDFLSHDVADLFVSNLGGHSPTSIRRVIDDHYRKDDVE